MRMIGAETHRLTQECSYGCCMASEQYSSKGRKAIKRRIKRSEKQEWRKEVAHEAA